MKKIKFFLFILLFVNDLSSAASSDQQVKKLMNKSQWAKVKQQLLRQKLIDSDCFADQLVGSDPQATDLIYPVYNLINIDKKSKILNVFCGANKAQLSYQPILTNTEITKFYPFNVTIHTKVKSPGIGAQTFGEQQNFAFTSNDIKRGKFQLHEACGENQNHGGQPNYSRIGWQATYKISRNHIILIELRAKKCSEAEVKGKKSTNPAAYPVIPPKWIITS